MLKNSNIITTIKLNSGLCITLDDETRHYYGGYYHVKVLAHCAVPLDRLFFDDETQFLDARSKLGESVRFERILEKMAVPEHDIATVRDQLVDAFKNTAISYLSVPDFDRRLVRNEYRISKGNSAKKLASRMF
jgi:translation initiation factor RLI1